MEYIYTQESARVLVVDDEKVIRDILADFLAAEGFVVVAVESAEQALAELTDKHYDLMITDLKMPAMGGLELLAAVQERKLPVVTVIMTGFATVETAIQAMKQGAYDYILKPFKVDEVVQIIRRGLEKQRLQRENVQLREVMNLYKVSEALSTSLSLDRLLQILIDTVQAEFEADAVGLILEQASEDEHQVTQFLAYGTKPDENEEDQNGVINEEVLLQSFHESPFLIAHGAKMRRYFRRLPERKNLSSFLSAALKARDEIIGAVNVYSFRRNFKFSEGQGKALIILASRAAQSIENARLYENLQRTFRETIEGLVSTLEAKDKYTSGHSRRVTEYALLIGRGLKFTERELERLDRAGLLHDIGKIGIRLEALNKPEKISLAEHEMFKDHAVVGKQILESIHFLREIVPLVYSHHEWWDGEGYPEGIKGEQIPLGARILAVADSYDAMTSDRPYRKALPQTRAIQELRRCSGSQFDPAVVEIFIQELEKNREEVDKITSDWMGMAYRNP